MVGLAIPRKTRLRPGVGLAIIILVTFEAITKMINIHMMFKVLANINLTELVVSPLRAALIQNQGTLALSNIPFNQCRYPLNNIFLMLTCLALTASTAFRQWPR